VSEGSGESAVRKFPVARAGIAFLVIPLFTSYVFFVPGIFAARSNLRELAMSMAILPVDALLYAWPGYVTFLIVGVPTLYVLYRLNRTAFWLFACLGALYTALPCMILRLVAKSPRGDYLGLASIFAVIGLANGILTRLIVFGRRPTKVLSGSRHPAPGGPGQTR
jgi:hypothetical protein